MYFVNLTVGWLVGNKTEVNAFKWSWFTSLKIQKVSWTTKWEINLRVIQSYSVIPFQAENPWESHFLATTKNDRTGK